MQMDGRVFTCSCCNAFKSLTLRALLNHCFVVRRNEPNFQVACNVDGCPAVFKKYNSFYKHVCKQHRAVYDTQAQAPQQGSSTGKRQDRLKMRPVTTMTSINTMAMMITTANIVIWTRIWMKITRPQIRYLIYIPYWMFY